MAARDCCLPVFSPALLGEQGTPEPGVFPDWPVIQGTRDNWDWKAWADHMGVDSSRFRIKDRFDMDEATIHAAMGGLGIALASIFFIRAELQSGVLAPLPGFEPVDIGAYNILQHSTPTLSSRRFVAWLRQEGGAGS